MPQEPLAAPETSPPTPCQLPPAVAEPHRIVVRKTVRLRITPVRLALVAGGLFFILAMLLTLAVRLVLH